jgi:hypothetical protein
MLLQGGVVKVFPQGKHTRLSSLVLVKLLSDGRSFLFCSNQAPLYSHVKFMLFRYLYFIAVNNYSAASMPKFGPLAFYLGYEMSQQWMVIFRELQYACNVYQLGINHHKKTLVWQMN